MARVGAEVGNTMPCRNARPSLLRPRFGKPDSLPPDLTRQAQQAIDGISNDFSVNTTVLQMEQAAGKPASIVQEA